MDIQELSKCVDEQVFTKTGEHLTSLQKSILEGVLNYRNYPKIVANIDDSYGYNYVKEEGAKLWRLLSDVFEEDIKQSNVRSILENKASSTIYNFFNYLNSNNISNSNFNICGENTKHSDNNYKKRATIQNNDNQSPIINLTKAPELKCNYGRSLEISTLKEWLDNKTRLITIYGLSGIGKTALTLKLISEIATEFDYIIYRSLENIPKLITLKDDLKQFFTQSQSTPLPDIIDYLICYRCSLLSLFNNS
ncbi:MAG: ATP-binding protein [Pseudanabaena sp.]